MRLRLAFLAALGAVGLGLQAAPFYRLESALTIPSESLPNWDYLTYDSSRDCLYIARRDDGIQFAGFEFFQCLGRRQKNLHMIAQACIAQQYHRRDRYLFSAESFAGQ